MENAIKTILDRFEHGKAVLITPFGQEIYWPENAVDASCEPGSTVYIHLSKNEIETSGPQIKTETKTDNKKKQAALPIQQSGATTTPPTNSEKNTNEIARSMLEELLNGE